MERVTSDREEKYPAGECTHCTKFFYCDLKGYKVYDCLHFDERKEDEQT